METFSPIIWRAYQEGMTDALGRAELAGVHGGVEEPPERPPGSPAEPVAVAWLPGSHGASVVPLDERTKGVSITLPRAIDGRGRVTVGGQPPDHLPAFIHVLAAYQDKGKLNEPLSIDTTCSADGTFELGGLTPGTYCVQAALDDIWLSPAVRLIVSDHNPPPIALDIPVPGSRLRVLLRKPDQSPLADATLRIERPAGPLTKRLWPDVWRSDGAGVVRIEGLGAGTHRLVLPGGGEKEITVPPASQASRDLTVPIQVGSP